MEELSLQQTKNTEEEEKIRENVSKVCNVSKTGIITPY